MSFRKDSGGVYYLHISLPLPCFSKYFFSVLNLEDITFFVFVFALVCC